MLPRRPGERQRLQSGDNFKATLTKGGIRWWINEDNHVRQSLSFCNIH